jgi:hypothetical protein
MQYTESKVDIPKRHDILSLHKNRLSIIVKPLQMRASFHSTSRSVTSSSRPMRPRSIHCIAATHVMSFVAEARTIREDFDTGGESFSRLKAPNAL